MVLASDLVIGLRGVTSDLDLAVVNPIILNLWACQTMTRPARPGARWYFFWVWSSSVITCRGISAHFLFSFSFYLSARMDFVFTFCSSARMDARMNRCDVWIPPGTPSTVWYSRLAEHFQPSTSTDGLNFTLRFSFSWLNLDRGFTNKCRSVHGFASIVDPVDYLVE